MANPIIKRPSSSSEYEYLPLDTQPPERAQAQRQNGAPGTARPVVWGSSTAMSGGAAAGAAWLTYNSFINGDRVGGAVATLVTAFCICAGCYALRRLVGSLSNRDVQPIVPDHVVETVRPNLNSETVQPNPNAEAARVHLVMLREIHSRLMKIVPPDREIDLEVGLDGDNLQDSIRGRLLALEQLLPSLKEQIGGLKQELKSFLQSRSGISTGAGLDSPGAADTSYQDKLLAGFDDLEARVHKAQASNNSSAFSSITSSPVGGGNTSSFAASPLQATVSPTARQLKFAAEDSGVTSPPNEEGQ